MPEPVDAEIGRRIAQARLDARLSQRQLAEAIQVTQTAVSYWEAGRHAVSIGSLRRIAELLGVPFATLIGDDDASAAHDPRWVELIELARVELKPGETLLVKPRDAVGWFGPDAAEELQAWLESQLPGVPIVVMPMQVDLGVLAQAVDGDGA